MALQAVTYQELDTEPGISLREPAGWVLAYVIGALAIVFVLHIGFKGAMAS